MLKADSGQRVARLTPSPGYAMIALRRSIAASTSADQREEAMDSTAGLPITQLTLYKHGVGFVERGGKISGTEVQLTFRADEITDALKSLFALDRAGGQIYGV